MGNRKNLSQHEGDRLTPPNADFTFLQNRGCFAYLEGEFATSGGGIVLAGSKATVSHCKIHNNYVGVSSDGFQNAGGGMYVVNSFAKIQNCSFVQNSAVDTGGAIFAIDNSFFNQTTLCLKNCLFDGNIGTAVRTLRTQVYLENCTFGRNYKWSHNDLFDLNTFPTSGPAGATVTNCIIRDNLRPFMNVTYSNVLDYPGEGNIDKNPMWVDVANGDFRLRSDSPCIDSGTDVEVLNDLDGKPRPVDVNGRGIGQGFDMGCYEFQLKRADLDQDGRVDGEDLLMFQEEWMREGE
ncbi:MAG: hypothetical protein KC944_15420 [Candidatus Omnitrophica bacterium]|nr:hypothetical protein [Candidatus Omnitrophota bacterium]